MQITENDKLYCNLEKTNKVEDYLNNFFNINSDLRTIKTYYDKDFTKRHDSGGSRSIDDLYRLCATTYENLSFYQFIKIFKKVIINNDIYGCYCHNVKKIVWKKRKSLGKYRDKRYRYLIGLSNYSYNDRIRSNFPSFWYNSKYNINKHGYCNNTLTREQIIKLFKKT